MRLSFSDYPFYPGGNFSWIFKFETYFVIEEVELDAIRYSYKS